MVIYMRKKESIKRIIILFLALLGVFINSLMYAYVWVEYYHRQESFNMAIKFYFRGHVLMIAIYLAMLFFLTSMYGGLKIGYLKPADVFFSQLVPLVIVNVITYAQLSVMKVWLVEVGPIAGLFVAQVIFCGIWAVTCNKIYKKLFPPRKLILIYGERSIDDIREKFASRKDKFDIQECINIQAGLDEIEKAIAHYEGVIVWDISTADRNKILKLCYSKSIRIYLMPKISDVLVKGSESMHLFDTPICLIREDALTVEQRIAKRSIDLFCAVILAVITSPIMLIAAIVIKAYDGGPVLYKQIRCTKHGKEFYILKFRSMSVDAEKDGVARLASKNDSRITPIGKFIRMVRIDELPQLFNIISGDMSFIGPRPERPQIIAQYLEDMPEFAFRTKVKAGLAGYAQVYGKYNTTPYDKLKLDLSYIETYSVWLDLKLMLLTLKILIQPESTEGIEQQQVTAMKKKK
ncbi:MAG: exopolysaccharide biosynthesis polyprenyl glycosylphosphotransferase [Eubacteriales bacterium]